MAHIQRRVRNGKVTYRVRFTDPAGRERSRTFARKGDAQRFMTETENAKARGTWIDPELGRTTFASWLERWWATTTDLRPSTRARNEASLRNHALPRFGELPLAAITQLEVRGWVADLTAKSLAPATVVKAYQVFSKVMGAAVDAGLIAQSPCRRVPLPRSEHEEMRFLTPTEVARLADAIAPRFRAFVLLGAYGGLRIGELGGLRRARLDLTRGTVTVAEIATEINGYLVTGPPKTRAGRRTVGLPDVVIAELAAHVAKYVGPESDALVFPGERGGQLRPVTFRPRIWRPATRAAGLDGLRPHDLRHTAVALWIAAGASPKEVAVRAGHTSVKTVLDVYGHLYDEADTRLRSRLDAMFVAPSAGPSTAPAELETAPARPQPHRTPPPKRKTRRGHRA
jgi:integrase